MRLTNQSNLNSDRPSQRFTRPIRMVVTIDGPAGAGKSSVARQLAQRMGASFLDTGALYRAATLAAMNAEVIHDSDEEKRIKVVKTAVIDVAESRIWLDGDDVSDAIRSPEVTANIRFIADLHEARMLLSNLQREFSQRNPWLVTEGRDQGTEVFPDAECKIFLTATDEERALRRMNQLLEMGQEAVFEEILAAQRERDAFDRQRPVGALREAEDSKTVYTDGLSESEVLDLLEKIVRNAIPELL